MLVLCGYMPRGVSAPPSMRHPGVTCLWFVMFSIWLHKVTQDNGTDKYLFSLSFYWQYSNILHYCLDRLDYFEAKCEYSELWDYLVNITWYRLVRCTLQRNTQDQVQYHYHTVGDFYSEEIRTFLVERIPKDNYHLRCDWKLGQDYRRPG